MLELIILDLFGTIVPIERSGKVRSGLLEFLDFYKGIPVAVFSDMPRQGVKRILKEFRLAGRVQGVYGEEDMVSVGSLQDSRLVKDLESVCTDFGVGKANAVFIGDNFVGRDARSAEAFGVRLIKVPQYRIIVPSWGERNYHGEWVEYEDPAAPFSFKSLMGKL